MKILARQSTAALFGLISCLLSACTIYLEITGPGLTTALFLIPPAFLMTVCVAYRLSPAVVGFSDVLFSKKSYLVLAYFLGVAVLTFTPIDDIFHRTWIGRPIPVSVWLAVSCAALGSVFAFLLYTLEGHGKNIISRIAGASEKILNLSPATFMVVCFIWIFCSTTIIGWTVFEHIPHVQDSIAQFFQAKIFAGGSLTAPPPPISDFFHYFYDNIIITQNKWYSQYPPGHPFFLMFGVLLGVPWLINPLAAACSVILLYKIALQFYGQQEAKLSVLLFSCSPFVLFMSASFMNHATTLFCLLLFVYWLKKSHTTKRLLPSFLGGVALGIMFTIRPGDACAIGAVFVSIYIFSMIRKKSFPPLLAFGFGLALMLCVMFLYNYATNGDPLMFGYEVLWGKAHSLGFSGKGVYRGRSHTPLQGLGQTVSNLAALNQTLFEWPLPSLFWAIILFIPRFLKKTRDDYLLLCGLFSMPVFYFFYFYQDLCLGPRFLYSSVPFAILLTARAIPLVIAEISRRRRCSLNQSRGVVFFILLVSVLFSAAVRMPRLIYFYGDSFWEVDNRLMEKIESLGVENAVVFQKSYGLKGNRLGAGFLHNSPWLDTSNVFAKDLGNRNAELIPFFPGRLYYLASRDTSGAIVISPLHIKTARSKLQKSEFSK